MLSNFIETTTIENPAPAVFVYKNALNKDLNLVQRLEDVIEKHGDDFFKWSEAQVGDYETRKDYRDCVDFKVRKNDFVNNPKATMSDLKKIYFDIDERLQECVKHYSSLFNLNLEFQEAVNFVRYGKDQHFQVHSDHGFSYVCTVSTVMYLNDNYTGGELFFPYINYTYTPEEGDIVLFPSNFLYSHAALPVKEGIKYSAVTMFDYNDRVHGANSPLRQKQ
jgi:predicted 2-oxoglutarate/Fe(II)-dependent dioxygenase YbiX